MRDGQSLASKRDSTAQGAMSELRVELDGLAPAEPRDFANALLSAAWSAALEETRILLLDLLVEADDTVVGDVVSRATRASPGSEACAIAEALPDVVVKRSLAVNRTPWCASLMRARWPTCSRKSGLARRATRSCNSSVRASPAALSQARK
jgi:hypothetical protein